MTYYLCDCPTHKDKLKWQTHTAETCRTHKIWLESKNYSSNYPLGYRSSYQENLVTNSNILSEPSGSAITNSDNTSSLVEVHDINALLEVALDQLGDNHISQDLISDALNVIK